MKILVTNNTLGPIGGSETYAYTLIMELFKRDNIEVEVYSPSLGLVAKKLTDEGVKIVTEPKDEYDLILCSHTSTASKVVNFKKGFKVQTCHGIYPALEQPYKGMDHYVAISEEVLNHLESKNFKSSIIYNGVNCERFNNNPPPNDNLINILSLTQSSRLNKRLERIIGVEMGLNFISYNKNVNPTFNIENEIIKSDLVITIGRGVYESMACGRNVFILDERNYVNKPPIGDGFLTKDNFGDFMVNNCSGRFSNHMFSDDEIKRGLERYTLGNGVELRNLALNELNIKKQVDKYIKLLDK